MLLHNSKLMYTVEVLGSNTRNLRAGERESDRGGSSQDSGIGQIPRHEYVSLRSARWCGWA